MNKIFNKNKGFTLAEVLITIGIIGIIAALTIPTLMNEIKNKEFETAFQKGYSNVINAHQKVLNENGGTIDFTNVAVDRDAFYQQFSILRQGVPTGYNTGYFDKTLSGRSTYNFFQNNGSTRATYQLKDGSMIGMFSSNGGASGEGKIIIDTNGAKPPNRHGYDIFQFASVKGKIVPQGYVGLGNLTNWQQCAPVDKGGVNGANSNGTNCTAYAIANKCPWDNNKKYWECLP